MIEGSVTICEDVIAENSRLPVVKTDLNPEIKREGLPRSYKYVQYG